MAGGATGVRMTAETSTRTWGGHSMVAPLLAAPFVELLSERGFELIPVPDEEFATQGPNVLALAPRRCLLLRENIKTVRRLRAAGCEVALYAGDECLARAHGRPDLPHPPTAARERRLNALPPGIAIPRCTPALATVPATPRWPPAR